MAGNAPVHDNGITTWQRLSLLVLTLLVMPPVGAMNWDLEFDDDTVAVELLNTVSFGAAWRLEEQDETLIGKASLPQNRDLCAADDCIGLTEDNTEPTERFLRAPGALASYADDGSINFEQGDVVAATAKISSRLSVRWRDYGLELSGMYFYDDVNSNFVQFHPNRIVTAGPQPGVATTSRQDEKAEDVIGNAFELRNANVYGDFEMPWGGDIQLRVGRQLLTWGVSAFGVNGSMNFINSPDLNALTRPGFELFELYKPQGMVLVSTGLTESLSMEAFYQYEWRPVGLPPKGSFFSFFDAGHEVVDDDHIPLPFSKTPEDPNQLQRPADDLLAAVADTSFAALRAPNREPDDGGQYGLALYYFAEDLWQGTEFGFYYANYHARIPAASFFAADAACTRREGNANNRDTSNFVEFLADCGVPFVQPPEEINALPLDSARYFLDYPEDIEAFGVSINTVLLGAALQGELVYRPEQPVQVDLEDVFFNALQPIFPRNRIDIPAPGAAIATLADVRTALPDFIGPYRGQTPGEVVPGSYVQGYERMKSWFGSLGFLRVWGPGLVPGADQFGMLFEANAVYLPDFPDVSEVQFEAPGTFTHGSPGIVETGNGLKLNPFQQDPDNFVTDFALGYRLGLLAVFNDVFMPGLSMRPVVVLVHDVEGISPGLAEIVLEDRKIVLNNLEMKYRDWSLNLQYGIFTGAGEQNTLRDRDVFSVALSYDF